MFLMVQLMSLEFYLRVRLYTSWRVVRVVEAARSELFSRTTWHYEYHKWTTRITSQSRISKRNTHHFGLATEYFITDQHHQSFTITFSALRVCLWIVDSVELRIIHPARNNLQRCSWFFYYKWLGWTKVDLCIFNIVIQL